VVAETDPLVKWKGGKPGSSLEKVLASANDVTTRDPGILAPPTPSTKAVAKLSAVTFAAASSAAENEIKSSRP